MRVAAEESDIDEANDVDQVGRTTGVGIGSLILQRGIAGRRRFT